MGGTGRDEEGGEESGGRLGKEGQGSKIREEEEGNNERGGI